jgi:hypothetical protein
MGEDAMKRIWTFPLAKGTVLDILLWSVGIGVIAMNVVLLQQNRSLRAAATGAPSAPTIVEGKHLGRNLAAATLDHGLRPISFPAPDARRTLLITFSPVCLIAGRITRTGP